MAKNNKTSKKTSTKKDSFLKKEKKTIIGILLVLFSICGLVIKTGIIAGISKALGIYLFGVYYPVLLLCLLTFGGYLMFTNEYPDFFSRRLVGVYLMIIALLVLGSIEFYNGETFKVFMTEVVKVLNYNFINIIKGISSSVTGGGFLGSLLAYSFVKLFSKGASKIVAIVMLLGGFSIFLGFSIVDLIKKSHEKLKNKEQDKTKEEVYPEKAEKKEEKPSFFKNVFMEKKETKEEEVIKPKKEFIKDISELDKYKEEQVKESKQEEIIKTIAEENESSYEEELVNNQSNKKYKLPDLSILNDPVKSSFDYREMIKNTSDNLTRTLKEYDIEVKLVNAHVGPAFTQYEFAVNMAGGMKLNKITSLDKEMSMALGKKSIKILAPIPGKKTVGIEVENDEKMPVSLKEILTEVPKKKRKSKLLVALGKNVMGEAKFCEINKTPHLLVAGATGSGKSVCINTMIISLLLRTTPDEVRLLLIDPKKVELTNYNGVPHLYVPVVTDPQEAANALQKLVDEMERRFTVFSKNNAKNIETYNNMKYTTKMPYIVCIIDELADLMMVASKSVQNSIMRITQMARACGIHLIVATQRPSTDIITGVVKSNIPSRISFAVSSNIDSRTILDMSGAEKLLGQGDMFFKPIDDNMPERIQGAFVTDEEIARVCNFAIKQQIVTSTPKAFEDLSKSKEELEREKEEKEKEIAEKKKEEKKQKDNLNEEEAFYNEVLEFVILNKKASASLIQRRFRVGFNKAARVIDDLEMNGIVGPDNGSKPRAVLKDESYLEELEREKDEANKN